MALRWVWTCNNEHFLDSLIRWNKMKGILERQVLRQDNDLMFRGTVNLTTTKSFEVL